MSVQNLCFDRLFNKKNDMKYFKNLIIVQMWATSIQLFANMTTFNVWIMLMTMSNAENWLNHTKSEHFLMVVARRVGICEKLSSHARFGHFEKNLRLSDWNIMAGLN